MDESHRWRCYDPLDPCCISAKEDFWRPNHTESGRGYEVTVGSDRYDAAKAIADLWKEYGMLKISFKFYSSCRLISATLEAAEDCFREHQGGR
jgi:hypothetical protein